MIWMTWRQFRVQALVAAAALTLLTVALVVTGLYLEHLYPAAAAARDAATCGPVVGCDLAAARFMDHFDADHFAPMYMALIAAVYVAPALIGVFWGAPLLTRELETGTFRLVWNQSVTRGRWLAVKLSLVGAAAAGAAGLLSLMVTWWSGPADQAGLQSGQALGRMNPFLFGARGIAPTGYALFGFALGVTLGVLIRRTVPAMAATLAAFAAVEIGWAVWVRARVFDPVHAIVALNPQLVYWTGSTYGRPTLAASWDRPQDWLLASQVTGPDGRPFTARASNPCFGGRGLGGCTQWLAAQHLRMVVTYQPASRFWDLQWAETGVFVLLALLLAGLCAWRVRREFT